MSIIGVSQNATNINHELKNKKLEITYDLNGEIGQRFFVTIYYFYKDSSKRRTLEYATGDLGVNINEGPSKKVIWDYVEDINSFNDSIKFIIEAIPDNFKIETIEGEKVNNTTSDNKLHYVIAYEMFIGGRLGLMYNHWGVNATIGTDLNANGIFFYGALSYRFFTNSSVSLGLYPFLGYDALDNEGIYGGGLDMKLVEDIYFNFDLGVGRQTKGVMFTMGVGIVF